MAYSISEFWVKSFLGVGRPAGSLPLPGWTIERESNPYFVEAGLKLRADDMGSLSAPIWCVAAPGAVGKSTLAREISARTGAVYLDLAAADTVAGYYLSGGLDRNGLSQAWERGEAAVLIDALDEARMRVPEASFEDFLHDVLEKSRGRNVPTVLFGRTGVVEEARIILLLAGSVYPVLVIDFFNQEEAARFILSTLERLKEKPAYAGLAARLATRPQEYAAVARSFVEKLTELTVNDAAQFAGYAPVLEAVANVLAGATNISTLQHVPESLQNRVLQDLTQRILEREADKLRNQLPSVIPVEFRGQLYSPAEQLDRLSARILSTAAPPIPALLPAQFAAVYEQSFHSLLEQHPFLDGTGRSPSGAVFDAVILAHALNSSELKTREAAGRRAGLPPQTPNPFLIDFYLQYQPVSGDDVAYVAPEHIVFLLESMQARAGAGETVYLTIEGDEDDDEADVEFLQIATGTDGAPEAKPRSISLRTTQAGELRFTRQVSRVTIDAPQMDIVIGSGSEMEIITPVALNIARLSFNCRSIVVLGGEKRTGNGDTTAVIEASELRECHVERVPILRDNAVLQVSWPGAAQYPWTGFQLTEERVDEPGLDYALGRLRKIVTAFRSHGRGELARYKHKIEHARMTKGPGDAIRVQLLKDGILSLVGDRYFLDPDRLGQTAGANYHDLTLKRFSPKLRAYVRQIIGAG